MPQLIHRNTVPVAVHLNARRMGDQREDAVGHRIRSDVLDVVELSTLRNHELADTVLRVELLGADRVCFGSDYPHVEGLSDPVGWIDEIAELSRASSTNFWAEATTLLSCSVCPIALVESPS